MGNIVSIAQNLHAAIGCDYRASQNILYFTEYSAGGISRINLVNNSYAMIGSGYTTPEDVRVGSDEKTAYVTERTGNLLKIDLNSANRSSVSTKVVCSGLNAPQQMWLDEPSNRIYLVEYANPGRLLRIDPKNGKQDVIVPNLEGAVGLVLTNDCRFAYISEQTAGTDKGRISHVNLLTGVKTTVITGLTQPFFLTWKDPSQTSLLLTERDPANRVTMVDLTKIPATVKQIVAGVPVRPSSVAVMGQYLIICSDMEISRFDTSQPLISQPTNLNPKDKWIVPLAIGNYSLKGIYGTGAGNAPEKIGLYDSIPTGLGNPNNVFKDGPFGGMLMLRYLFSDGLEQANVIYYRIKARLNGAGSWTPLDHVVNRHYSKTAPGTLVFVPYSLGPKKVNTEDFLYEIKPQKQLAIGEQWVVLDVTVDLVNGYFDSYLMQSGYVEFKLELFDNNGVRVNPSQSSKNIAFKLPSTKDLSQTVLTVDATAVNSSLVVTDPENTAYQVFVFKLQIDHIQPLAVIDDPYVEDSAHNKTYASPDCGIINYKQTDSLLFIPFQARHPRRFGIYSFSFYRSQTSLSQMGSSGQVMDMDLQILPLPFSIDSAMRISKAKVCQDAAFSENLYIWHMNYNGWSRVGPDASDTRAFALVLH
jgi:hypothetical protein